MNTTAQKIAKFLEVKDAGTTLVFAFGNGETVRFNTAHCSEAIRARAEMHGFNQKLRDSVAGFSKEKDYVGAMDAMGQVAEALLGGEWNRQGGGERNGVIMADLAFAISQIRKAPLEKCEAAVAAADPEKRKAWAKNAQIAVILAERKAERAKAAASTAIDEDMDFGIED